MMINLRWVLVALISSIAPASFTQEAIARAHVELRSAQLAKFSGQWIRKVDGRNFAVLNLQVNASTLSGTLSFPTVFNEGGSETEITGTDVSRYSIIEGSSTGNDQLQFATQNTANSKDQDHIVMTLRGNDRALIVLNNVFRWKLERTNVTGASVATSWPSKEPKSVSPEIAELQRSLKTMVVEDQAADVPPYTDFPKICEKHYPAVRAVYEKYGWPKFSLVGRHAASDYWLLATHESACHPDFAKQALQSMKSAVDEGEASMSNYVLFYDSIAEAEGKPQHWGTRAFCKNGKRELYEVDDPSGLDERRVDVSLAPVSEYFKMFPPCPKQ